MTTRKETPHARRTRLQATKAAAQEDRIASLSADLADCRAALKAMRAALRSMPGMDPFSHGPLAEADSLAEAVVAKAEGRAND